MIIIYISIKSKQVFLILLILVLFSSFALKAQEIEEINLNQLITPTKLNELINNFEALSYSWQELEAENANADFVIKYSYQGQEKVRGKTSDKIVVSGGDKIARMEIWLAEEEIVKMKVEEQLIPAETARPMIDQFLKKVFFPYSFFEETAENKIKVSEGEVVERKEKTIGDFEAEIIKIKLKNLEEYNIKSGTVQIAKAKELMTLVNYNLITRDNLELIFAVQSIKLR